jgi:hypothetical protein
LPLLAHKPFFCSAPQSMYGKYISFEVLTEKMASAPSHITLGS